MRKSVGISLFSVGDVMEAVRSYVMDHHGLVAATCQDLKIIEKVNARIQSSDHRREIQPGFSVVAMIINGLGFTNRRLYLTPQFYESKPISRLLGADIRAEQLTDHTLGKTLDEIYDYGPTKFFSEIAFEIAHEKGLFGSNAHIDSTTFSLEGKYEEASTDPSVMNIAHGFSKDHRRDLKQVMMSMVVNGPAEIPLWMEPQSGNTSDKTSFHETVKRVQEFQKKFSDSPDFLWIADSAFYSKEKMLSIKDYTWISRVPETLSLCKDEVEKNQAKELWIEYKDGYKFYEKEIDFEGIKQRWLVVFSEQAYAKEMHTLEKSIAKEKEELENKFWHMSNKIFNCQHDAERTFELELKKIKYHKVEKSIIAVMKMPKRGRPKETDTPIISGYKISEVKIFIDEEKKLNISNKKGKFVLATNEMNLKNISSLDILKNYKEQQSVERGFRFIKDPYFMLDSFFLKKPSRMMALMVVMALCLLVYNFSQYQFRQRLEKQNETIPDQKQKEIKKPTARWIFQCMEGIALVVFIDPITYVEKVVVTNLTRLRQKIIKLWGETAARIYGIEI